MYLTKNIYSPVQYSIIDCLGKTVYKGTSDDKYIDVSMLKSGLYFLRLQDKQNNVYQNKFLKQ
ncbi:MAG: T9SS type A sorting domain-containing protein [Bacteroidia bacterium]